MSTIGEEPVTYEAIAPLIATSTDDVSGVDVTFRCAVMRSSVAGLVPSRSLDQLVAGRTPGRVDFEETTPGAGPRDDAAVGVGRCTYR